MGIERVFEYFKEISEIERVSYHEEKISDYLVSQGTLLGCGVYRDRENNVIIRTKNGSSDTCPVILQAHTDMVWEGEAKEGGEKIPRDIQIKDGKMYANGTTLGADDGIGVALILAVLEDAVGKEWSLPLEAVFTANEEETMGGAMALSSAQVTGKYLINLDSEKEGVFTVGAAGGISARVSLPLQKMEARKEQTVRIWIKGGVGGHSGLDIGKKRENAIKLLTRFLQKTDMDIYELEQLEGGSRINAIPVCASALVRVSDICEIEKAAADFMQNCKAEWSMEEPELSLYVERAASQTDLVLTAESRTRLLALIEMLPHGVAERAEAYICSSVNLALVSWERDEAVIELSLRSSYSSWWKYETERIRRIASMCGGQALSMDEYAAWPYGEHTFIQTVFEEAYASLFGIRPVCENVHAGVECGIIMENCPSIKEGISLGPTITGAHTVSETLFTASVERVYSLLKTALKNMEGKMQ